MQRPGRGGMSTPGSPESLGHPPGQMYEEIQGLGRAGHPYVPQGQVTGGPGVWCLVCPHPRLSSTQGWELPLDLEPPQTTGQSSSLGRGLPPPPHSPTSLACGPPSPTAPLNPPLGPDKAWPTSAGPSRGPAAGLLPPAFRKQPACPGGFLGPRDQSQCQPAALAP